MCEELVFPKHKQFDQYFMKDHRPLQLHEVQVWACEAGSNAKVTGADFFPELPHTLRMRLAWAFVEPAFMLIPAFEGLPPQLQRLIAAHMTPVDMPGGLDFVIEGAPAQSFWLLHQGMPWSLVLPFNSDR